MAMDMPMSTIAPGSRVRLPMLWTGLTVLAAVVGLCLIADNIWANSATYDEVTYLRIGARWWRTGQQAEISRMGTPLTSWKLQQAPVLWLLDHTGHGPLIDDPITHQRQLLPLIRLGSLWIWFPAFLITVYWSRSWYGPRAMTLAAWIFAISPNLIAHGALATMELPLLATSAATFLLFWRYLETRRIGWFIASAAVAGLAFSCKFTAILLPPLLAVIDGLAARNANPRETIARTSCRVAARLVAFGAIMVFADLAITSFAMISLSPTRGEHPSIGPLSRLVGATLATRMYESPIPQDLVGFITQTYLQVSGGASYLFGERKMTGWWYYYFVALAVKLPLAFWWFFCARLALGTSAASGDRAQPRTRALIVVFIMLFLTITALCSSRNYGVRYLLPLAPLAIVWISAVAESSRRRLAGAAIAFGLGGYAVALIGIHPYELTYFNELAGGPIGGRRILSDSNLDWGQGLISLERMQAKNPELRDITLYYFGETQPAFYGVSGRSYVVNATDDHSRLPKPDAAETRYIAISASLQHGPCGPPGFFRSFDEREPALFTDDKTIAIYRRDERLTSAGDR
jgi:hypothetical protein